MSALRLATLLALASLLCGCTEVRYYYQSVKGHLDIVSRSQEIDTLLADNSLSPPLREKLSLVNEVRAFAANELHLSFNDSYSEYADLHRDYVVRNLFAAREFSVDLYSWCYPVIGCANYRGFFDQPMLQELRDELDAQGYDTHVSQVTAYSTLGWFDDPVLNTFVELPDYQLVALLLHEIAHQQVYVAGDTFFNESFAMAVEQAGLKRFYSRRADQAQVLQTYAEQQRQSDSLIKLAVAAREELQEVYQGPITETQKRQRKHKVLDTLQQQYRKILAVTEQDVIEGRYNLEFNNARLGAVAAYHSLVPAFTQILAYFDDDFAAFFIYVDRLSGLDTDQRALCLEAWSTPKAAERLPQSSMCPPPTK